MLGFRVQGSEFRVPGFKIQIQKLFIAVLPTAYWLMPTKFRVLPTAYCQLPTYFRVPGFKVQGNSVPGSAFRVPCSGYFGSNNSLYHVLQLNANIMKRATLCFMAADCGLPTCNF